MDKVNCLVKDSSKLSLDRDKDKMYQSLDKEMDNSGTLDRDLHNKARWIKTKILVMGIIMDFNLNDISIRNYYLSILIFVHLKVIASLDLLLSYL